MTAVCSGGPSGPKPGVPAVNFIVGVALSDLLEAIFPETAFAELLGFIGGQTFDAGSDCPADPPAVPTFTAFDVVSIITLNPFLAPASYGKLTDLVRIAAWYTFCQCTAITTPAPPSAPPYPSGAPTINPPQIPPQTGATCSDIADFFTGTQGSNPNIPAVRCTPVLPGSDVVTVTPFYAAAETTSHLIPTGAKTATLTWDFTGSVGSATYGGTIATWDSTGTRIINTDVGFVTFGPTGTHNTISGSFVWTIPTNAVSWQVWATNAIGDLVDLQLELAITCGPNPNTPIVPCCPPDDTLAAQLQAILNLLTLIYSGLSTPAHSFAEGTVHAGLTTSGNFVRAAGTIAIRVVVHTPFPAAIGIEEGDPEALFSAGFITFSTAEGNYKSSRITHSPQVFIPDVLADTVHYTITPTSTLDIIELTAGP